MGYPKFGKTLGELTETIRENNVRKGFRPAEGGPGANSFGDYIALAHSELSEALEAYRDHRLEDATEVVYGNRLPKPEGVGSELADAAIRLLDMADVFGIDLEREIVRKIAYNATRPYQHGGRTVADAMQPPVSRNVATVRPMPADESDFREFGLGIAPQREKGVSTLDRLRTAMPDDPRDWWTGDETDDFISRWITLGLPYVPVADATGERLTLWCTDLKGAAGALGVEIRDYSGTPGFEIIQGEYSVGVVQAEDKETKHA